MDKVTPSLLSSYEEYSKTLFAALVEGAQSANSLDEDFDFYKTAYPQFSQQTSELSKRLIQLQKNIVENTTPNATEWYDFDGMDTDEQFQKLTENLSEVMEYYLDKVDGFIDDLKSKKDTSAVTAKAQFFREKGQSNRAVMHVQNVLRPQEAWKNWIDNRYTVFIPKITHKFHAKVPLDPIFVQAKESVIKIVSSRLPSSFADQTTQHISFPHPYRYELTHLEYPARQLESKPEILFLPLEKTSLTWVSTVEALHSLVQLLKNETEIAIDLEHHAFRTYQGITCLMQISTRKADFIVDTLALMTDLECLNEVFTNPQILKVLHGADHDVKWLQRDFGLYLVNMFDTGQASRVLGFTSFALSHLLLQYCGVTADKSFQIVDWRVRPIPEMMLKYAREDTHYLLYIYDRLRNEAIAQGNENMNLLMSIYERSKEICLSTYEKDLLDAESHVRLLQRNQETFNDLQMAVFKELFLWRDFQARSQDESTQFILPDKMLINVARSIPRETNQLLACCTPIPPMLRIAANDIIIMIQDTIARHGNPSLVRSTEAVAPAPAIPPTTLHAHRAPTGLKTTFSDSTSSNFDSTFVSKGVVAQVAKNNTGYRTDQPLRCSLFSVGYNENYPGKAFASKIKKEFKLDFCVTDFPVVLVNDPQNPSTLIITTKQEPKEVVKADPPQEPPLPKSMAENFPEAFKKPKKRKREASGDKKSPQQQKGKKPKSSISK